MWGGNWSGFLCGLVLGVGLVASTTMEDLMIVRLNLAHKLSSPYLSLLSAYNRTLANEGVFVGSGMLTTASMGNLLALYFDAMACCDIVGAHFVYRSNIIGDEQTTAFFESFPQIRMHPHVSNRSSEDLSKDWKETCPYVAPYPHVHAGAWNQRSYLIAEIIQNAVNTVYPAVFNATIPFESFSHILPKRWQQKVLPLVPSAAIVFRCVDILFFTSDKPNYGFLNFNAYAELIPKNASFIYVLSEQLSYRDQNSAHTKDCKDLGVTI